MDYHIKFIALLLSQKTLIVGWSFIVDIEGDEEVQLL